MPVVGLGAGDAVEYGLHIAFIVLMICANILMLRFYVLSMQENGAAKATVQNFGVNYLASIFFGYLLFSEKITVKLCFGVLLILSGVGIISTCEENIDDVTTTTEKNESKKSQ